MKKCMHLLVYAAALLPVAGLLKAADVPQAVSGLLARSCTDCHDDSDAKGGLNLETLPWNLAEAATRDRWVRVHDRIEKGEMPPKGKVLEPADRQALLASLGGALHEADHAEVAAQGRGPLRRLNRDEYEQNLRDLLELPALDVRSLLPEDRRQDGFNKSAQALDMSHVELEALMEAAGTALRQAVAPSAHPPQARHFHATATGLFQESDTFGGREAMFYARDSSLLPLTSNELRDLRKRGGQDTSVEMALFRSASWPYYGYPDGFIAEAAGDYVVKFSARAVRQVRDFRLVPGTAPQPMTFRARARSGPDVSGDVKAVGGVLDILPEEAVYQTVVHLKARQTIEYSLLGLPVPLPITKNGGPLYYDFPPMPEGGHPGVAFRWLDITGPVVPASWPPASHRVLFGDLPVRTPATKSALPVEVVSQHPREDAVRLFESFAEKAARGPVQRQALQTYERLILDRLDHSAPFAEAMLEGFKAFLCSGHFLYLREPVEAGDHYAIAARLSHFLINSRPDAELEVHARDHELRSAAVIRAEALRLVASPGFERFIDSFTAQWLDLKELHRDEPDVRLYPEYRLDDYLIDSMGRETRAFITAMVQDNLPAAVVADCRFAFVNDRLARHYDLPPVQGSTMRQVALPASSPYGGLLTQAALLRVTANGTTTSPVVRGAWMMTRLLGDPPPPPPPTVPAVEPDIRGATTLRQILAQHKRSASCAACHARFDPVGMALENFDIMGGWRGHYRGVEKGLPITGIDRAGHDFAYTVAEPVDASGELLDGRTFHDVRALKALLAARPRELARNLLHQFTAYATGSPVRFSDRREIESILDACEASRYGVRDLLLGLVTSKIFLGEAGCNTLAGH